MGNSIVTKYAFLPPRPTYTESLKNFVWIMSRDRKIPAVYFEYDKRNNTLLFTHGNAEDIGELRDWMSTLSKELKVNICAYDYRGYGLNGPYGECSERDCYDDIYACYYWLIEEKKIPKEKIILFGRSLGTGPTVHMGAELCKKNKNKLPQPFGGMILQSPLTSAVRVVSNYLSILPATDMFQNIDKIDKVRVPVFIIHGDVDTVVPHAHGLKMYDTISQRYRRDMWSVKDCGHNDIEAKNIKEYVEKLRAYIASLDNDEVKPPVNGELKKQDSLEKDKTKVEEPLEVTTVVQDDKKNFTTPAIGQMHTTVPLFLQKTS